VGRIHETDARSFMRELPDALFDLIVCDGLTRSRTHEWDNVPDIQHFNLELLKSFFPIAQARRRGLFVRQAGLH